MSNLPDLNTLIQNIDTQLAEVMRNSATVHLPKSEKEKLTKYILVGIDALRLAIAIDDLAEVGPLPAITFLPNLPPWIQGIVNIRSEIISVIDFAGFLKIQNMRTCQGSRFMVLQHKKQKIGIRLDTIIGTVSRTAAETKPLDSPDNQTISRSFFAAGLFNDNILYSIIHVRKLLTAPSLIDYYKVT
jgi:purine-binding chemotaxis protein CheW